MPRSLTRAQALENDAFLAELRRTGNARGAARAIGIHRAKMTKRRAKHPAFAAEWDAALALAHAALNRPSPPAGASTERARRAAPEPHVLRRANGRLQLRRAQPRRLTRVAEQRFLLALSASANIRLAAAAAGFSHSAFYQQRHANPAFAREWRLALAQGYEALEVAMLASIAPSSYRDDAWREDNAAPDLPQMSAGQMLQLMYLHQKEARLLAEPPHLKRRRGECCEAHRERLCVMAEARLEREREKFEVAEAAREARGEPRHLPPRPVLPALDQVTGWSTADPAKTPHHADRALFGGWRLSDLHARR
jgi:hypothetical protein